VTVGVDLGTVGVPDCDAVIKGESNDEVMDKVRQHFAADHEGVPITDDLLATIEAAIGPIKKD